MSTTAVVCMLVVLAAVLAGCAFYMRILNRRIDGHLREAYRHVEEMRVLLEELDQENNGR